MRFIETPTFTRVAAKIWSDAEYHSLQLALFLCPGLGAVIPQSGGLRKTRWSRSGIGKRGGVRVIYFWDEGSETVYMLYAFAKSEKEDLTAQQLRVLRQLVHEEFG
jgi:hypothetical protein